LRKVSSVSGMIFSFIGVAGIVGPIICIELRGSPPAGQAYSPSQYRDPAIYCGACYLVSSMILWVMRSYLIARDEKAEVNGSHMDSDELHIKVGSKQILSKLFVLSTKTRKV
jgi:hypothetical protein